MKVYVKQVRRFKSRAYKFYYLIKDADSRLTLSVHVTQKATVDEIARKGWTLAPLWICR